MGDDADSVKSSSSMILSSKSSIYNQDIKQQPKTNPEKKHNPPKRINSSSSKTEKQETTLNKKLNDQLDTKENILNQKPRQPVNHHRNGRQLNSSSRIKTDINLKPVVKRAAANKASDKIAKDSAALNRSLDQPFSTSTSDASSGKEKKFHNRSNRNKNVNISFSSSSDSSDIEKDGPIAKQKRQQSFTNHRRSSKSKENPRINSNTKKTNANNLKTDLDKLLAPTAQVQFSRTTSDEEEKDFEKVSLPKIPNSDDSHSVDDNEDKPVVSFLKRRSSNTDKASLPRKPSKASESPLASVESKPKRLSEKSKSKTNLNKELEEKENLVGRSSSSTTTIEEGTANGFGDKQMLKNLSWPEQLARMKKARSSATRASLDSCNSADSLDLPTTKEIESNQKKLTLGQKQMDKKISKAEPSPSSKLKKGQAGKDQGSKTKTKESFSDPVSSKKSNTSITNNDRTFVYDFEMEEPISQSPHAKKKGKNAPKIVKNSSPVKTKPVPIDKSDTSSLPPQLEPQVEVAGKCPSKHKKSKESVKKGIEKQPPLLESHVATSSSIISSRKDSTKMSSEQSKNEASTKTPSSASSSRGVTPCETQGGNGEQISIMAFVKKRKEAAIAATKSPPKENSKLSDVDSSDIKLSGTVKDVSENDNISFSDKTLVNEKQRVEIDDKKIPT